MNAMLEFGSTGILLGLVAGISPGPLLTLVISQTLLFKRKEGFKVAVAPLITDIPIVIFSLFISAKFTQFDTIGGIISILGSMFILYLSYEAFFSAKKNNTNVDMAARSYQKGILVNFLSPHPYLFWLLVGAPMFTKATRIDSKAAIAFIVGFYFCLIGSKIIIALLADKSKAFLNSKYYIYLIQFLGLLLLFFALKMLVEGIRFLI